MLFQRRERPALASRIRGWLWPRRGWRRAVAYIWHRVTRLSASPHEIALGFAAGMFASFTPFMGFHFLLGAIVALLLGGNVLASAFGTFVGNPLTFPLIWIATYNLGGLILGHDLREKLVLKFPDNTFTNLLHHPLYGWQEFWSVLGPVVTPMSVGGVVLGTFMASVGYVLVRPVVTTYQSRRRSRLLRRKGRWSDVTGNSKAP